MLHNQLRLFAPLCLGVILTLTALLPHSAHAQTLTVLYSFSGSDGSNPKGGLIQGTDGNFYGTTHNGGSVTGSGGTFFSITPSGMLSNLHNFTGTDGFGPYGALSQGTDGKFYGGTGDGIIGNRGTIFSITLSGILTTLHSFYGQDGVVPDGSFALGTDGKFYGATNGDDIYNIGTIFSITPNGSTFTEIHTFTTQGFDGSAPSPVIFGSDGSLYGTTGAEGGNASVGTVFKMTPSGTFTTLHHFFGAPDGAYPFGALVLGKDGNFYGTTIHGGTSNSGTVFSITPSGTLTTLYSFTYNGLDGASPFGALVLGKDGNFYGKTTTGGTSNNGTIFSITPSGILTTLHSFTIAEGTSLYAELVQGTDGNFYGTTYNGGANNQGSVFKLTLLTLATLLPNRVAAGHPSFTLNVTGSSFVSGATINFNGTPLNTAFVSATQLHALVPASDVATAGTATITVVNPNAVASNSLPLTITVTSLALSVGTITRNSGTGVLSVPITLTNTGYADANNTSLSSAKLKTTNTTTTLPVNLGNIVAGSNTTTILTFPGGAGVSGANVNLVVTGTYTGGTFNQTAAVTLP